MIKNIPKLLYYLVNGMIRLYVKAKHLYPLSVVQWSQISLLLLLIKNKNFIGKFLSIVKYGYGFELKLT